MPVSVVAVDPWDDDPWGDVLASRPPWYLGPKPPDSVVSQLNAPGGLMHTCLANLAPHRDRIVPVRARARDVLDELADLGLRPDLVYIDADKKREDLDVCHRLWPDAVLSGDDYLWAPDEGYPMQRVVKAFARDHGYRVMHKRQTWLLRRGPLAWLSHRLGDLGRARSAGA